jgi:hypothetical protein
MKSVHTLTSERTRGSEQRYLVVEPCSCPSSRPFVLDSNRQPRPMTSVTFSMEVNAPILRQELDSINSHFLGLIMKFIPFGEAIGKGDIPEANHPTNIFRGLPNDVGG